ncbi:hypothetical protein pkur_cds_20 [Pandoravirus kuranda]|uniref:Uncharacterized protein n=1 Tax=Pandoravirus kuranda TaxID=3019033 RepID=A0AA95ECF0_9VIRU|nr:hypothetical protein pkur_cds_20 [Pandoravirus kuranda]
MSIALATPKDAPQDADKPVKGLLDEPMVSPTDTRKRKRTIPDDVDDDSGSQDRGHECKHDTDGYGDGGSGDHTLVAASEDKKRSPSASPDGSKVSKAASAGQPRTIEQLAAAKKPASSPTVTTTIVRRTPPAAAGARTEATSSSSAGAEDELTRLKRELEQMAKAKADAEARLAAVTKRASGNGRGRTEEDARAVDPLPDEPWAMSAERRGALVKEAGRVLADAEEHWRQLDAAQREAIEAAGGSTRSDRARAKTAGIAHAGMWIRAWGFMHYHMACLYKETIAGGRAARVGRGVPTDPEELAKAEARAYAPLMVERIRMARFFHETIERFHQEFSPPTDVRGRPIKPQVASMPTRHMHTVALAHPALGAVAIGPEVAEVAALPENARTTANLSSSSSSSSTKAASRRSQGSLATRGASPPSSAAASPRPAKRSRTSGSASKSGTGRRRNSSHRLIDDEVDDEDDEDDDEDVDEDDDGEDLADFIDDGDEDQDASADDSTADDRRSVEEGDDNDDQKDSVEDDEDEADPRAARKRKMASLAAKAQAARSRRR